MDKTRNEIPNFGQKQEQRTKAYIMPNNCEQRRENLFWLRLDLLFANVLCSWCWLKWYTKKKRKKSSRKVREKNNNNRPINIGSWIPRKRTRWIDRISCVIPFTHWNMFHSYGCVASARFSFFFFHFFLLSFTNYLNNPIVYSGRVFILFRSSFRFFLLLRWVLYRLWAKIKYK